MLNIDQLARLDLKTIVLAAAVLTLIRTLLILISGRLFQRLSELLDALIFAGVLVFLLVRPFFAQTFWIPTGSMRDTLLEYDYILANKMVYRIRPPHRGEIVVFEAPPLALHDQQSEGHTDFIKRAIAMPGDIVEIKHVTFAQRGLFINHMLQPEKYIKQTGEEDLKVVHGQLYKIMDSGAVMQNDEILSSKQAEIIINSPAEPMPPGKMLVLGDNRRDSSDSRVWGLLDISRVIARADLIFWPPPRWRFIH